MDIPQPNCPLAVSCPTPTPCAPLVLERLFLGALRVLHVGGVEEAEALQGVLHGEADAGCPAEEDALLLLRGRHRASAPGSPCHPPPWPLPPSSPGTASRGQSATLTHGHCHQLQHCLPHPQALPAGINLSPLIMPPTPVGTAMRGEPVLIRSTTHTHGHCHQGWTCPHQIYHPHPWALPSGTALSPSSLATAIVNESATLIPGHCHQE